MLKQKKIDIYLKEGTKRFKRKLQGVFLENEICVHIETRDNLFLQNTVPEKNGGMPLV